MTHFQFTVSGSQRDLEPSRFNNYVLASKAELQDLRNHIDDLRGCCHKIAEHMDALNQRTGRPWLVVLGRQWDQRSQELANTLHLVYGADNQIIALFDAMLRAAEIALRQVTLALVSATTALPENVPAAAKVLEEYTSQFEEVERDCLDVVGQLGREIEQLR